MHRFTLINIVLTTTILISRCHGFLSTGRLPISPNQSLTRSAVAFHTRTGTIPPSTITCIRQIRSPSMGSATLHTAKNKDDDETEVERQNKNPVAQIAEYISLLFSYIIQFLGVAFSLGLILNICGYGYTFDFERGLEIDRMENIRKELQFRREIVRSANDAAVADKGAITSESSALPR